MANINRLSGGEALKAKLLEISKRVGQKATLNVGFLEGATPYPDGTPTATVAAIQEFGAPAAGIPPRPFFRPMIAAKSREWGPALGGLLKTDDYDAQQALNTLGLGIEGQLKQSIRDVEGPELSQVTLLLRERFGNNPQEITFKDVQQARADIASGKVPNVTATQGKPLIWTGHMVNSVGYEVES
jgi:hypothetical protein